VGVCLELSFVMIVMNCILLFIYNY